MIKGYVILVILIFLSVFATAITQKASFGDYVQVTVTKGNLSSNITNETQNNTTNNNITNSSDNKTDNPAHFVVKINQKLISKTGHSVLLKKEENKSDEVVNDTPEENKSNNVDSNWILLITIFIFIVGLTTGLGFAGYKGYNYMKERGVFENFRFGNFGKRKKIGIESEVIPVSKEIYDNLMKYKDPNWTWNEFMRRALILIEENAKERD